MQPDEIRAKLEYIITVAINKPVALDSVRWESRLQEDLAIDSLETVEFLFEIEEHFGIKIDDAEAAQLKTVRDAVEAIERKLKARDGHE